MDTYSGAEAKNRLPNLIDQALGGETVVVTRRGTPIVELTRTGVAIAARGFGLGVEVPGA
jgi:antitoxin (DNA-binding transcriptional repressor) of toxin-antitoxin stability system